MTFFIDWSTNATIIFPNITKPNSYLIMETIIFYQGIFTLALNLYFLYIFFIRLRELKHGETKRYVVLLLIGNVFFSAMHDLWAVIKNSWVIDYSDKLVPCVWLFKLNGTFYIFSAWFIYLILLERETTAREGLKPVLGEPGVYLNYFRLVVHLAAKYTVPGFALICLLFFQGRIIFKENSCDQYVPTWASGAMGSADTVLSLCLLFLFLDPVLKVHKASYVSSYSEMYSVAKNNLFWSSIMIFTTMVSLFTMTATLGRVEVDSSLDIQWFRPFAWFLANLDLLINTLSVLAIYPGAWLPNNGYSILKYIFRYHLLKSKEPSKGSAPDLSSSKNQSSALKASTDSTVEDFL